MLFFKRFIFRRTVKIHTWFKDTYLIWLIKKTYSMPYSKGSNIVLKATCGEVIRLYFAFSPRNKITKYYKSTVKNYKKLNITAINNLQKITKLFFRIFYLKCLYNIDKKFILTRLHKFVLKYIFYWFSFIPTLSFGKLSFSFLLSLNYEKLQKNIEKLIQNAILLLLIIMEIICFIFKNLKIDQLKTSLTNMFQILTENFFSRFSRGLFIL